MTPEQRQALREQRRAERERQRGQDGAAPSASPLVRPRRATVKVVADDGSLQERDVMIGISNRIHAEVLSGLAVGDRIVTGVRQADRGGNSASSRGSLSASPFGPPGAGGPPPGMSPAAAGRAR